jgi:valyl-tRNA synthetase
MRKLPIIIGCIALAALIMAPGAEASDNTENMENTQVWINVSATGNMDGEFELDSGGDLTVSINGEQLETLKEVARKAINVSSKALHKSNINSHQNEEFEIELRAYKDKQNALISNQETLRMRVKTVNGKVSDIQVEQGVQNQKIENAMFWAKEGKEKNEYQEERLVELQKEVDALKEEKETLEFRTMMGGIVIVAGLVIALVYLGIKTR